MLAKTKKITIEKIPDSVQNAIRQSFSYQGLKKALNSKIITKADIKAEAILEQKNPDLLMDQRVHTVLLADMENNKVKNSTKSSSKKPDSKQPQLDPEAEADPRQTLKEKLGPDFSPGWKGIDEHGDLLEVLEITDQGWLKFKTDKISGKIDIVSYPIHKFLKELETDPVYNIDDDDAKDLVTSNLENLDNNARLDLIEKIHTKTLAKLHRIKSHQRELLENALQKNESKKMQELLAKINGTESWCKNPNKNIRIP